MVGKNQISQRSNFYIGGVKDFPIFSISCFLLKTQLVEFELKQLISSLDQHLYFSIFSQILKIKTRTPKDLDEKILTLGKLKDEINKYEGSFLNKLKKDLSSLVKLRNNFVHSLFNLGSINAMISEAEKGLNVANEVIKSIESVNTFLKDHYPLKR